MGLFGGDSEEFLTESFDDMARDLAKFLVRLSKGEVATHVGQSPKPDLRPVLSEAIDARFTVADAIVHP